MLKAYGYFQQHKYDVNSYCFEQLEYFNDTCLQFETYYGHTDSTDLAVLWS